MYTSYWIIVAALVTIAAISILLFRTVLSPRGRRIAWIIVMWFGFGLTVFTLAFASLFTARVLSLGPTSWWNPPWEGPGDEFLFLLALIVLYIGVALLLTGGLVTRPHHIWIVILIAGVISILAFYGAMILTVVRIVDIPSILLRLTLMLLPGLACITGSLIIREKGKKYIGME
jgi:hypothetical protein